MRPARGVGGRGKRGDAREREAAVGGSAPAAGRRRDPDTLLSSTDRSTHASKCDPFVLQNWKDTMDRIMFTEEALVKQLLSLWSVHCSPTYQIKVTVVSEFF